MKRYQTNRGGMLGRSAKQETTAWTLFDTACIVAFLVFIFLALGIIGGLS